jgi:hypothetical protein
MGNIRVGEAADTPPELGAGEGWRVRQVPRPQGLPLEPMCGGLLRSATAAARAPRNKLPRPGPERGQKRAMLDLRADASTSRLSGRSGWPQRLGSREVTRMGGGA